MPMTAPSGWIEAGLAWLYPPVCQICHEHRATTAEGLVCSVCWRKVRFIRPPFCDRCGLPFDGEINSAFECTNCRELDLHFSSARSAVTASGIALEIIHRYKYQRAVWFEPFLADLLTREAAPVLRAGHWDMIVPVPLHPVKEREREFNQAARLCRHLGRALDLPVKENLIRRLLSTRTQTLLTRTQRAENVRRAFACYEGVALQGKRIVVVDDVFTTGSTTNACAAVLRKAGAGEVCVWTVARGL